MKASRLVIVVSFLFCTTLLGQSSPQATQPWLADRGTGVATSLFGTYVNKGQLLVYPFLEYYVNNDYEYKPEELGRTNLK